MTFTAENIFFLGAVLIFASIVISKWGYRFGVPNGQLELRPGDILLTIAQQSRRSNDFVGDCQQKGKNVLDETVRKVGLNRKARLTESSYLCRRKV